MGRLGHTLSTLRPVGRPTGRKPRFRLLARLCRVGSLSHWVPPKGFFDASYIAFPLSQASLAQARVGPHHLRTNRTSAYLLRTHRPRCVGPEQIARITPVTSG